MNRASALELNTMIAGDLQVNKALAAPNSTREAHGYGKILGGGMVCNHAGDMIGEIALASEMAADAVDIGKTIHPHPTLGESIGMAAEIAHGSCTDVPPSKR